MMKSLILAATTLSVLGYSSAALAAVTAQGTATLEVQPTAAINVTNTLTLPSVTTVGLTAIAGLSSATGLSRASINVASSSLGNATLTISGQAGDAVSMAVPESFRVIRTGGTETLTVKTNTNVEYNLAPNGIVGGLAGETMSVNVGGALSLASADRQTPGAYQGLLVVVVQYN